MSKQRGFTLIELMVVVAIIAIVAAVAVPSYLRYSIRARRVDGQNLLMRVADAQERYYSTNNRYGSLDDLEYTAAGKKSEHGYYQVSLDPASDGTTYTAIASPVAGSPQAQDDCETLTISNTGEKGQTGSTTNGSCW